MLLLIFAVSDKKIWLCVQKIARIKCANKIIAIF